MPLHTVGLLELGILHTATETVVHPYSFSDQKADLYNDWPDYVENILTQKGIRSSERYLTIEKTRPRHWARGAYCEFDYGSYGSQRRVRDSNNGQHVNDIKTEEVASDALRMALFVPKTGTQAYITHEVVGRASLVSVLRQDLEKWFKRRHPGYELQIRYVEDADAWRDWLEGADLKGLTFEVERSKDGNRLGRPTRERYEVVPSGRGEVLPSSLISRLLRGERIPPTDVLAIDIPVEDIAETKINVSKDGRQRSIRIGDDWPRFTWEIDPTTKGRPDDEAFLTLSQELFRRQLSKAQIDE